MSSQRLRPSQPLAATQAASHRRIMKTPSLSPTLAPRLAPALERVDQQQPLAPDAEQQQPLAPDASLRHDLETFMAKYGGRPAATSKLGIRVAPPRLPVDPAILFAGSWRAAVSSRGAAAGEAATLWRWETGEWRLVLDRPTRFGCPPAAGACAASCGGTHSLPDPRSPPLFRELPLELPWLPSELRLLSSRTRASALSLPPGPTARCRLRVALAVC